MDFLSHLPIDELLFQLPSYLSDSANVGECVDFVISKLGEDGLDDVSSGKLLKMIAKEVRGKRGISKQLLELLPLLSRPSILIEHLTLFLSEDNISDIPFIVETLQKIVQEDRSMVMTVLGTFGGLASLLAASSTNDLLHNNTTKARKRDPLLKRSLSTGQRLQRTLNSNTRKTPSIDTSSSSKLTFLEVQDIRNEIFNVCIDSISLVDVADMPTLIRTLLFALTVTNASRGLAALRDSTQRFSAADMAPILPVLYTSLRLTPQLGSDFLTFCTNHASFTLLDLYFFVIILESPTPSMVAEAWKVLDEAILRKSLNLALLRAFALNAADFLHLSDGMGSQNVLFSISEHLMHAPNPILIDMGTDFSVLLFYHFPALRLQILDALLSIASHAVAQPFLKLDPKLLQNGSSRLTTTSNISNIASNKNEIYRQAMFSLDMWRFPMRSLLELCATQPKFVAPFYLSIEDSLLLWSHKGQSLLIEKMLPHERRHWISHMHCMAESLSFLAPFQSSLFGTLMMLIQKQTCSSNPLSQSCGIILAHHTIQANWTQHTDRRFIISHLLRTCPPMIPMVRIYFYELISSITHLLDEDHLQTLHTLFTPAISTMQLIDTQKKVPAWDIRGFSSWTTKTQAHLSLPSQFFNHHSFALLKCHLKILSRIDPDQYRFIMTSKIDEFEWECDGKATDTNQSIGQKNGSFGESALNSAISSLEMSYLALRIFETVAQASFESQLALKCASKFPIAQSSYDMDQDSSNASQMLQQEFLTSFSGEFSVEIESAIVRLIQMRRRQLAVFENITSSVAPKEVQDTKAHLKSRIKVSLTDIELQQVVNKHNHHLLAFNLALSLARSSNKDAQEIGLASIQEWMSYLMVAPALMGEFDVSRLPLFSHHFRPCMWPSVIDTAPMQTFTMSVLSQMPSYMLQTDETRFDIPSFLMRQGATASGCSAIYQFMVCESFSLHKDANSKLLPALLHVIRVPVTSESSSAQLSATNVLAHLCCFAMQLESGSKSAVASVPLLSMFLHSLAPSLGTGATSERLILQSTLENLGSLLISLVSSHPVAQNMQIAASFLLTILARVNQSIAARFPQALESLLKRNIVNDYGQLTMCQSAIYWPLLLNKQISYEHVAMPLSRIALALLSLAQSQSKWTTWRQAVSDAIAAFHDQMAEISMESVQPHSVPSHPVYRMLTPHTLTPVSFSVLSNLNELCRHIMEPKKGLKRFSAEFLATTPHPLPLVVNFIKQAHILIIVIGQNGESGIYAEWRQLLKNWTDRVRVLVWASIEWRRLSLASSNPSSRDKQPDMDDEQLDLSQEEEEDAVDSDSSLLSDVLAQALHFLHEMVGEGRNMLNEAEGMGKSQEKALLSHTISRLEKLQGTFIYWSKRYHIRVNLDYSHQEAPQAPISINPTPPAQVNGQNDMHASPHPSLGLPPNPPNVAHMSGFQQSQLPETLKQVVNVVVARKKTKPNSSDDTSAKMDVDQPN